MSPKAVVLVALVAALSACERPAASEHPEASKAPSESPSAPPKARALADACEKGEATSCLALGVAYSDAALGLPHDETRAADFYERACDLRDIRNCNNLTVMFEKEQGRPVDAKRAFQLYTKNCDAKHALACKNVGRCHRDGLGVPADAAKAKAAFQKAVELSKAECARGVAEGCSNIGFTYRAGNEGLPKDETRAVEYLERACKMGYRAVCSRVHPR